MSTYPTRTGPGDPALARPLPGLRGILRSRLYPAVFQWPTLVVFGVILYETMLGPVAVHDNFGSALTWVLWWPLIPLTFFLAGRFWCAICPFALVSDLVQKVAGLGLSVPPFLKRYGIWIIDFFFLLITWGDHIWGMIESPRGTGIVLLSLLSMVVVTGLLFERRTFCRHLCFIGGLAGNYSRAGILQLRADAETCRTCDTQNCYRGGPDAPGCKLFQYPRALESSATCNLCGDCVKNCPHESIRVSVRPPTSELWFLRRPRFEEAFLAVVIAGVVLIQNITMLPLWPPILNFLETGLGLANYTLAFTVAFLASMVLPFLALFLTAALSAPRGEGAVLNFSRFGYGIIPLDFSAHMAHNFYHLLAEFGSIAYTGLLLVGIHRQGPTGLLSPAAIQKLQYGLVILGLLASVYVVYRIAQNHYGKDFRRRIIWPHLVFLGIVAILNLYLFSFPMSMRM